MAEKMNATFLEVSAKTGTNINELFEAIAQKSIEINTEVTKLDMNETRVNPANPPPKKKGCCE